jgi:hypothetical protein
MKTYFWWIESVFMTGTDHTSSNIISRLAQLPVRCHGRKYLNQDIRIKNWSLKLKMIMNKFSNPNQALGAALYKRSTQV